MKKKKNGIRMNNQSSLLSWFVIPLRSKVPLSSAERPKRYLQHERRTGGFALPLFDFWREYAFSTYIDTFWGRTWAQQRLIKSLNIKKFANTPDNN